MKLISGGRMSGKTTQAIHVAAEHDAYIVCANRKDAERIARTARELELKIRFPITFDEWMEGSATIGHRRGFVIDGAELVLRRFARGNPVHAATFCEEP